MLIGFVTPPISAVLMKHNLWIPMLLGLSVELIALPLAFAVPETLDRSCETEAPRIELPRTSDNTNETRLTPASVLRNATRLFKTFVDLIFQDWRVPPLIMTSFLPSGTEITTLYVSKRYNWSIADATFLVSVRSGINLLVFALVLPVLSTMLMHRFSFSSMSKDLWLARVSCILVSIGYGVFGFAPDIAVAILGMIIYTFGNGHGSLIRSLLTSLVEKHHFARLFTLIGIVNTVGLMIRGPLLAGLFQEGLQFGGLWVGLPFYLISGTFVCVTFLMFAIGVGDPYWKRIATLDTRGEDMQAHGEEDGRQDPRQ